MPKCDHCGGTGRMDCLECDGYGYFENDDCDVDCDDCDGDGQVECSECFGTGEADE